MGFFSDLFQLKTFFFRTKIILTIGSVTISHDHRLITSRAQSHKEPSFQVSRTLLCIRYILSGIIFIRFAAFVFRSDLAVVQQQP